MLAFLTGFVERYGYIAVAVVVTVEGLGVPLPGETAVVTAAAFAAGGALNLAGVVIAATIGAVLGGSGGYWIGRLGGRGLLVRHGHLVGLDAERLARTEHYFVHHGMKTVFFARFVALLRIFGCLLAGTVHMPFLTFSVMNMLGGLLWAVTFSALGYLFGENLPLLEKHIGRVSVVISVMLVIGLAVYWWRRRQAASGRTTSL